MKLTRILPKFLAKTYQAEDLRRAEISLQYYRGMVSNLEQRVAEGRFELERLGKKKLWTNMFFVIYIIFLGRIMGLMGILKTHWMIIWKNLGVFLMDKSKKKKKSEAVDTDESFDYDQGFNLEEVYDWWILLPMFSSGYLQLL